RATELDPKHLGAEIKLAEMAATTGDAATVANVSESVSANLQEANNAEALIAIAMLEWRLGKYDTAEERLRETFEKTPTQLQSVTSLAQIRLTRKDWKGAEEILKAAVEKNSKSAAAHILLGEIYTLRGQNAEAAPYFERAAQLDPKNGAALLSLANSHL